MPQVKKKTMINLGSVSPDTARRWENIKLQLSAGAKKQLTNSEVFTLLVDYAGRNESQMIDEVRKASE